MLLTAKVGVAGLVVALTAGLTAPAAVAASSSERRAPAYKASLAVSSPKVLSGDRIVLAGKVSPALRGGTVILQKRVAGASKWATEARLKTTKRSTFRYADKPTRAGVRQYRVVVPKSRKARVGVSKAVTVTVYQWRPLTSMSYRKADSTQIGYATINARPYRDSYIPTYQTSHGSIDWNINPACVRLRAHVGNGDESDQGATANVVLSADGAQLYAGSFGLTQSDYVSFSTRGVFRLAYSWTSTLPGSSVSQLGAQPVFADPQLLCSF